MPVLARTTDDSALGDAGSGGGGRHGRANPQSVCGYCPRASAPDRTPREPAVGQARSHRPAEKSARHLEAMTLSRRLLAEFLGTAFLLIAVVGSGIMGERLAGGNMAITLLANSLATGGALLALILAFGPISGAHFNPAVSLTLAARGEFSWKDVPSYAVTQLAGAILGVAAAQAMFELPLLEYSVKARPGLSLMWAEFIATFGLLAVIISGVRFRPDAIPYAVAAYITGA